MTLARKKISTPNALPIEFVNYFGSQSTPQNLGKITLPANFFSSDGDAVKIDIGAAAFGDPAQIDYMLEANDTVGTSNVLDGAPPFTIAALVFFSVTITFQYTDAYGGVTYTFTVNSVVDGVSSSFTNAASLGVDTTQEITFTFQLNNDNDTTLYFQFINAGISFPGAS